MLDLIVQPSQDVFDRSRVIVLNKPIPYAQLGKFDLVIAIEAEPAFIFEYRRLDQTNAWKRGLYTFHCANRFRSEG
jgi:hypothetical protein